MKLLSPDEAPANNPLPVTASPPAAAETVANGKSEREVQLEAENAKLRKQAEEAAAAKKKVETDNAHLADENQRLKQLPAPKPQPAKEKFKWAGFGG